MHLLTHSPLLRALGWSLLNSLWQMAGLWFLYCLLSAVFPKASAKARHGLAMSLLGIGVFLSGLTCLIAFLSPVKPYPFFMGFPLEAFQLPYLQLLIRESLPYLSAFYLLVLTGLFIRFSRNYIQSNRLNEKSLSKAPPELRVFIKKTSLAIGIKKEVRIWLSSKVTGPLTYGFLRPVILLPLAMAGNLSFQQTEAILLHELAHIKRHDYLLNMVLGFVEMIFFFNPFSRLLIRDIKKEREHCCDDLVIQFNYAPHAYAAALLSLAKGCQAGQVQFVLSASGINEHLLLKRVKRILQQKEPPLHPGAGAVLLGVFFLASAFFMFSAPSKPSTRPAHFAQFVQFVHSGPSAPSGPSFQSGSSETASTTEFREKSLRENKAAKNQSITFLNNNHNNKPAEERYQFEEKDKAPGIVAVAGRVPENEDDPGAGIFASIIQPDLREFTLRSVGAVAPSAPAIPPMTEDAAGDVVEPEFRQPFVPSSNFTFRYIQDTIQPDGRQLVYMQKIAGREIELAIKNLKLTILRQLRIIQTLPFMQTQPATSTGSSFQKAKEQIRILEEQLKLQQDYLLKQQELERKLEKTGKRKTIVVI